VAGALLSTESAVADTGPAAGKRAAAVRARRGRRLRTMSTSCKVALASLSGLERRVLVLRAGVGVGSPRTRSRVAHQLGLSTRRVIRLERRGPASSSHG
jgi:DNA-directed RNA polymerase sigma subunit (sigma70/sigma32)